MLISSFESRGRTLLGAAGYEADVYVEDATYAYAQDSAGHWVVRFVPGLRMAWKYIEADYIHDDHGNVDPDLVRLFVEGVAYYPSHVTWVYRNAPHTALNAFKCVVKSNALRHKFQ